MMKVEKKTVPVSVLICTHNRKEKLKRCLASMVDQSHYPDEILIVGSRVSGGNIKCLASKKKSIPYRRNLLIKKAKNEICLFVDDDVCLDEKAVFNCYRSHKNNRAAIIGGVGYPEDKNNIYENYVYKLMYESVLKGKTTKSVDLCPTMILSFKKSVIKKLKVDFDERFENLEDIDWCLSLKEKGEKILMDSRIFGFHDYRDNRANFYLTFKGYFGYVRRLMLKHSLDVLKIGKYLKMNKVSFFVDYFGRSDNWDIRINDSWQGIFQGMSLTMLYKLAMFMAIINTHD